MQISILDLIKKIIIKFRYKLMKKDELRCSLEKYSPEDGLLIDIGANEGQWLKYICEIFPYNQVIAFEPIGSLSEKLNEKYKLNENITIINKAVSNTETAQVLNITSVSGNSSFFDVTDLQKTSSDHERVTKIQSRTICECTTIDMFLNKNYPNNVVKLLKIDAQGAEGRILEGAKSSLKSHVIKNVYVEIMFAPIYTGQSSWLEICNFLESNGYWLHSIHGMNSQSDLSLTHANALFISNTISRKKW